VLSPQHSTAPLVVSAHVLLPPATMEATFWHWPATHGLPQAEAAPQFPSLPHVWTALPEHCVTPGVHTEQWPEMQVDAPLQPVPHCPQFALSLCKLTQAPLQLPRPALQVSVHVAPLHAALPNAAPLLGPGQLAVQEVPHLLAALGPSQVPLQLSEAFGSEHAPPVEDWPACPPDGAPPLPDVALDPPSEEPPTEEPPEPATKPAELPAEPPPDPPPGAPEPPDSTVELPEAPAESVTEPPAEPAAPGVEPPEEPAERPPKLDIAPPDEPPAESAAPASPPVAEPKLRRAFPQAQVMQQTQTTSLKVRSRTIALRISRALWGANRI
jgi:hypothetical protein